MFRIASAVSLSLLLAGPLLAQAPVTVVAKRLGELAVHPQRSAPAGVLAANESRIAAEVAAKIVELPVEVGQTVAKGAVVARVESRDFELAIERAQAALDSSQARLRLSELQARRARELFEKKFLSEDALSQRETEIAVLRAEVAANRAQLATARRNLEKCVIRSPFRAAVKARMAQIGELTSPGTPIVVLVETGRIEVAAAVPAADARSLSQAASIVFESQGAQQPARLLRITAVISREARTREVRLSLPEAAALPGAEGRILWSDPAPHVAADLLVRREGRLGVFTLKGDTAEFFPLREAQEGRPAAIGLAGDAMIITDGRHALRHGQKVSVSAR